MPLMGRSVLYCFLIVAFIPIFATAQQNFYTSDDHLHFNGGLILGANLTQVDGDTYYGYNKIGLNAGGIVLVHFTPSIGASMELLYSQKGSRSVSSQNSSTTGVFDATYSMTLNYVEAPLLLHYTYRNLFDIEGGISYAYLVHASESATVSNVPVVIDPETNKYNTTDLEYNIGANARLYKQWHVDVRYQYSIVPIRPTERVPAGFSYGSAGQFNNLFAVRVMYIL